MVMRFKQYVEEVATNNDEVDSSPQGTYIAVWFDAEDVAERIIKPLGFFVPDLYKADQFHTTIMYAPYNDFLPVPPRFSKGTSILIENPRYEVLGEDRNFLTIVYDNALLLARFNELNSIGLKPTYPKYKSHITLTESFNRNDSYGDDSLIQRLPPLSTFTLRLREDERSEPLNSDWK